MQMSFDLGYNGNKEDVLMNLPSSEDKSKREAKKFTAVLWNIFPWAQKFN